MSSEQNTPESPESRTGYGQTAYKRRLAYQRLGIDPNDVQTAPFFHTNISRIARCINQGRGERPVHAFDYLCSSEDPDALKLAKAYVSVPESYRRLLPPEAFCVAAGLSPSRVLELIAGAAVRQGAQASTVVAAIWHPRVVEKTIQRALGDDGEKDRLIIHRAMGFVPSGGSTSIRERLV